MIVNSVPAVIHPTRHLPGHFIDVDGVQTYYRVDGQGPPMLLLHGLGMSHHSWSEVTAALAEHSTVYTLDMPGFGYSDKPAAYRSARQMAAFVERFLTKLQLERVTVVGHSMGGTVALWLAAEHAACVDRLVVVDAAEIGTAATLFRVIGTPLLGDVLLRFTTTPGMRWLLRHAYVQKQVVTSEMAATYVGFLRTAGAREALIAHARSYETDKQALLPRLGAIPAPTLILWGDRDPFFPLSVARELQQRLGGAQLEVIAEAGHIPQEEQPERFQRALLRWLGDAAGPSRDHGSAVADMVRSGNQEHHP